MSTGRPILVTGLPRSGTTWVGRMIAQAPDIRYVHEPFNITGRRCSCKVHFNHWFHYISQKNENLYSRHLKHTIYPSSDLYGFLNLISEVGTTRRIRPLTRYAKSYSPHRPLVKDPLAVLSAEWLASTFDMDVVVVIRHPAAVVNSYKTLNWSQSFSDFLNQPLLMREHLAPFETEICEFAHNKFDIIDQIAFLWKLTHHVLLKYRQIRPNWIFVRHIDLAQEPISNFRCIFEKLQIPLDLNIERKIMAYSSSENSTQSTDLYSVKRDSRQVVWNWKNQLKLSEITRIRERVKDVSEAFYSEEEW